MSKMNFDKNSVQAGLQSLAIINGTSGNDVLTGTTGDDVFDGGPGNDTLNGNIGNNTYLFGRGDGRDVIAAVNDTNTAKVNVLQFKAGVAQGDLVLRQTGDNGGAGVTALEVSISGTADKVIINGFFGNSTLPNPYGAINPVQYIVFDDSSVWDINEILNRTFSGSAAADTMVGTAENNLMTGQGGNDTIYGRSGDDTISGGVGDDRLYGDTGDDTITGDSGNDIIYGADGNDVISAGDGNDSIYADIGDDFLEGNAGNDFLSGGVGNNTYLFGRGDGVDTIQSVTDTNSNRVNVLQLKAGIGWGDIQLRQIGDNGAAGNTGLEVAIIGTSDKVIINGFFGTSNPGNPNWNGNPVQYLVFNDGSSWDVTELINRSMLGTESADTIFAFGTDDVMTGKGGNDALYGRAGHDTISGGNGDDKLYGEADNDVLTGDAGIDSLYGDIGDDILDGGVGNDSLHGGIGNNTYLFGRGDGTDIILSVNDTNTGKVNVLQFKAGIGPADIQFRQVGDGGSSGTSALEVGIIGTSDKVVINGFFGGGSTPNPYLSGNPVQLIQFNDGSGWDLPEIINRAFMGTDLADSMTGTADNNVMNGKGGNDTIYARVGDDAISGGSGDDKLYGEIGNDVIAGDLGNDLISGGDGDDVVNGGDGNDTVAGDLGDDTLDGNAGNDILNGGIGNNVYLFGRGDGTDIIQSVNDSNVGRVNVLQFKAGVNLADIQFRQVGDNGNAGNTALEMLILGTTDKVIVNGFFGSSTPGNPAWNGNPVQYVAFQNGDALDINELFNRSMLGTEAADTIYGSADANQMTGKGGNDNLYGRGGDDVIGGGLGDDKLYGEAGHDTLNGDAGNDTLSGSDGDDALYGGDGNDTLTGDIGNDFLEGNAGNDVLNGGTGDNYYSFGRGDGFDIIQSVSDGTTGKNNGLLFKPGIAPGDILVRQVGDGGVTGNSALELSISGSTDKVVINGFFGNASLPNPAWIGNPVQYVAFSNGAGWDINELLNRSLIGNDAANTIIGSADGNVISGLGGNDTLYGRAGDDAIEGGLGDDRLYGETGDDTLRGDGGNDTISGGDGTDALYGGDGNDTLMGDAGDDTLDGNAGNDQYNGGTGNNVYSFGRGDGIDVIQSVNDVTTGKYNIVALKPGLTANDIVLGQIGDGGGAGTSALQISILGSTDKLIINGFFGGGNPPNPNWTGNPVQAIFFNDGSGWDIDQIVSLAFSGTAGTDTYIGTAADNIMNGQGGGDTISGRSGNDTINGGLGADRLYGETGDDTLYGGGDNDGLYGGDGNDMQYGGDGDDTLLGDAGNDYLEGNAGRDILQGGTGDDILIGGIGNDTFNGGTGNNLYVFNYGDGQDLVQTVNDGTAGKLNTLHLSGINPDNVIVKRVADSQLGGNQALQITFTNTTDKVVVNGFFYGNNPANVNNPVQQLYFDNGAVWDLDTIVVKIVG